MLQFILYIVLGGMVLYGIYQAYDWWNSLKELSIKKKIRDKLKNGPNYQE